MNNSKILSIAFVVVAAVISCKYMRRNQWKITPKEAPLAADFPEYWETDTKSIINPNQNLTPYHASKPDRHYFD